MIKKVLAAAGLGFAAYVVYEAYNEKQVSTDSEGGFLNAAFGIAQSGFSKVSNFGGGLRMNISLAGLAHIKGWEGFRQNVYLDAGGKPTIGYGHLIKPTESFSTITNEAATMLLIEDLMTAEDAVNALVKINLSQFQYDALVSFVFNVGRGAFARSTLLKKVNAGNFAGAKSEFLKWVNAGGKRVAGLVNRRVADSELFAAV